MTPTRQGRDAATAPRPRGPRSAIGPRTTAPLVLLLVAGCGSGAGDGVGVVEPSDAERSAEPYDADATLQPGLLAPEPARSRAGESVSLFFPEETSRGLAFVLEAQVGEGWDARFLLTAGNATAGTEPSWTRVGEPSAGMDLGVGGPGPDRVVVPDEAQPGPYRICTANAVRNFCAPLEVLDR